MNFWYLFRHWKKNQINTSLELELAILNVWQQTQNSKQQLAAIPLLAAKSKILASLVNKNGIIPLQWSLNKLWFSLILCIWHFGLKCCTANVYSKLRAVVLKTVWAERLWCVIWKIMKSKCRQYRWKRCWSVWTIPINWQWVWGNTVHLQGPETLCEC